MIIDIDINLMLLKQYKLEGNYEAVWQLYKNIEYLLKKSLKDPFYIYPDSIKNQRYYKFYVIEKRINKKISIKNLLENYRIEFIQQNYLLNYLSEHGNNYSLDLCFIDFLDEITCEGTEKYIKKFILRNSVDCKFYIRMKFCDMYWRFIEKCLRRDFPNQRKGKSYSSRLSSSKLTFNSKNLTDLSKCSSGSSFINSILIKETIDEFKQVLNDRDKSIIDFLAKGDSYDEICETLEIKNGNLRKRINGIRSKLTPIHAANGYRLI